MAMTMFFKLVYLALIYAVEGQGLGYKYGCPDLRTCQCSISEVIGGYYITVTCSGFGNEIDLTNEINRLTNYEIDELVINGYTLQRLPEKPFLTNDLISRTLIKTISITNSPNLLYLGYSGSNFTFFDGLAFCLETIYVESCNNIIPIEWSRVANSLSSTSVLKTLVFYNNILSFSNFDYLNGFKSIEALYLRSNLLYSINVDLTPFQKLNVLDLCNNILVSFVLKGNAPQLTTIYLRNNQIISITQSTLDVVKNLKLIDYSGNPLSCFCQDVGFIVNNDTIKSMFKGTCAIPSSVAGRPLDACAYGLRIKDNYHQN